MLPTGGVSLGVTWLDRRLSDFRGQENFLTALFKSAEYEAPTALEVLLQ